MPANPITPRPCAYCDELFTPRTSQINRGNGRFCSRSCGSLAQQRVVPVFNEARFWERVDKTDTCWLWTGTKNGGGYGQLFYEGKRVGAHRVAWIITNGPIPEGYFACHHCDNPPCVRPDHLFLGTVLDNNHDCATKGRKSAFAIHHPRTRLTAEVVQEIRRLHQLGMKQSTLSEQFGITSVHVNYIVHWKIWKHLPASSKVGQLSLFPEN